MKSTTFFLIACHREIHGNIDVVVREVPFMIPNPTLVSAITTLIVDIAADSPLFLFFSTHYPTIIYENWIHFFCYSTSYLSPSEKMGVKTVACLKAFPLSWHGPEWVDSGAMGAVSVGLIWRACTVICHIFIDLQSMTSDLDTFWIWCREKLILVLRIWTKF